MRTKHPMQPIELVDGVPRFKRNSIVRFLLDNGPFDLNKLTVMVETGMFPREDYVQLTQLIGYSVCGFGDLSSSPRKMVEKADRKVEKLLKKVGAT
jgi:hypothetical protein